MENPGTFILDFLAQMGGGRGGGENELARTFLGMVFWGGLLALAIARRREKGNPRENILVWAFSLGIAREAFLFMVFALDMLGIVSFSGLHLVFPPLEHALLTASVLLVAGAYIRFLLDDPQLANRYLAVSAGVTVLSYSSTATWWTRHIMSHPESRFGLVWCDWLFHLATLAMLVLAMVLLLRRRGAVRNLVLAALAFFALDDILMIVTMAGGDLAGPVFAPIRHNLHLWAIPLLGVVYLREMGEEGEQLTRALQAAQREKDTLLKEVHHRVKNNLQSVNAILEIRSGRLKDEKDLQIFRECRAQVASMAMVHEKLYQARNLASVPMEWYLRTLADHLWQSFAQRGALAIRVRAEGIELDPDIAIPCGLMVAELVSNSLKHAFPGERGGEIGIGLERSSSGWFILLVEDDGVGLSAGRDHGAGDDAFGLRLVRSLAEQLGGHMTVEAGKGTSIRITFPDRRPS
jgi:two-component sensor histidine kinase